MEIYEELNDIKDKKNLSLFLEQADIVDILWVDEKTALALCDIGDDEDWIFLIKDGDIFEWQKIMPKSLFVKTFGFLYEQFTEMHKNNKNSKFLNERLKNEKN